MHDFSILGQIDHKFLRAIRSWVWVSALLLSLMTTQWLGFVHRIGHPESRHVEVFQANASHEGCEDHNHAPPSFLDHEESSIECQIYDAVTLASMISGNPFALTIPHLFSQSFFGFAIKPNVTLSQQPYQSRAPPFLIL
jgi:hypothetical protein